MTLAELAAALDAAKSSVQELTNGLLARGYLIGEERRFHLGPGPFILAARANKLAAVSLDHGFVAELAKVLGCAVLVGVRVGDASSSPTMWVEEDPSLTFVARTHARRPLYTSAAGKTLLANVPDEEMYRLLDLAGPGRQARSDNCSPNFPKSVAPTRFQPRSHVRGRVCRGHSPAGTRRQSDRGDQRSRRRFRSGPSRPPRRRTQEGHCHSRPSIRAQTTLKGRPVE